MQTIYTPFTISNTCYLFTTHGIDGALESFPVTLTEKRLKSHVTEIYPDYLHAIYRFLTPITSSQPNVSMVH